MKSIDPPIQRKHSEAGDSFCRHSLSKMDFGLQSALTSCTLDEAPLIDT